jgi:hypothetical protein
LVNSSVVTADDARSDDGTTERGGGDGGGEGGGEGVGGGGSSIDSLIPRTLNRTTDSLISVTDEARILVA